MEKDIRFTGHTAVPSDYECSDGELTQCHNLINEHGTVKSVLAPKVLLNLGEGRQVILIHKTTNGKHYIIHEPKTGNLYWMDDKQTELNETEQLIGKFEDIISVTAIGNTLVILRESGVFYSLWEITESGVQHYRALGDHMPFVNISFGLKGHPKFWSVENGKDSFDDANDTNMTGKELRNDFSEENQTKMTNIVMAKVNSFLRQQTVEKGRFCMPFFVRYALRLYDNSLVNHSAPILMMPTVKGGPLAFYKCEDQNWETYYNIFIKGEDNGFTQKDIGFDVYVMAASLDYCVLGGNGILEELKVNWKDIVKSIDVFISQPIYDYAQGGKIKRYKALTDVELSKYSFVGQLQASGSTTKRKQTSKTVDSDGNTVTAQTDYIYAPYNIGFSKMANGRMEERVASYTGDSNTPITIAEGVYGLWQWKDIYNMYANNRRADEKQYIPSFAYELPLKESVDDKSLDDFSKTANFYYLAKIELDELESGRKDIDVPDDYLQSLTAREVMTDDYKSNDKLQAAYALVYNQRLNLSGIKRTLFEGYRLDSMMCFCETTQMKSQPGIRKVSTQFNHATGAKVVTYIRENGKTYKVESVGAYGLTFMNAYDGKPLTRFSAYLYYPNSNAYKMVVDDGHEVVEYKLTPHEMLNGSFVYRAYSDTKKTVVPYPTEEDIDKNPVIDMSNKIYTSEVNNPFYFPLTGINTIGVGKILGISTAAKALSQGQFGQFPLYAFTDEGVWSLKTNSTGGYSAVQPITRDVCISSESITQIDTAVLFATDRGIMQIAGSETQCITDIIDGDEFFDISQLPGLSRLYPDGLPQIDCTFADYRKGARMAYDYTGQRIYLFNETKPYAYVFSLRSKLWGIVSSTLFSAVNSYPEAYAMAHDGEDNVLVDLSRSDETHAHGLLVTRPIKLDAGSILKTIDTVFMRGMFGKGKASVILYGSRDNMHWHLVHSAKQHYLRGFRGSPYKYYRIVAVTDLSIGETLRGASVTYTPRLTNQLR